MGIFDSLRSGLKGKEEKGIEELEDDLEKGQLRSQIANVNAETNEAAKLKTLEKS